MYSSPPLSEVQLFVVPMTHAQAEPHLSYDQKVNRSPDHNASIIHVASPYLIIILSSHVITRRMRTEQ